MNTVLTGTSTVFLEPKSSPPCPVLLAEELPANRSPERMPTLN